MTEEQQSAFAVWQASQNPKTYPAERQAFVAGWQAALQSQVKKDTTLFCDLKTDEEKSAFFLSGRGYETGVIAQAIQNDVAMAYHRCAEYKKELEALQSQDRKTASAIRGDSYAGIYVWYGEAMCVQRIPESTSKYARDERGLFNFVADGAIDALMDRALGEAIDHARRVEGES